MAKQELINIKIRAEKIRLIAADGSQVGVVARAEALRIAEQAELDLVMVAEGDIPVCRIMDYGKYKYQQSKKTKTQPRDRVKEIKLRPTTDEGDFNTKRDKLIHFLDDGHKVKVTMRFRGREMAHREIGAALMQKMLEQLSDHGLVDQEPKFEGRQMVMMLSPRKRK